MFRLPVSGREIELRLPVGWDELLLLEQPGSDTDVAISLAGRLARDSAGAALDAVALPVTDLDVVLLLIRRMVFGDSVVTDLHCPARGCGARVDVDFRISAYITHHAAHQPRQVSPAEEPGWFRLQGREIMFRIPTGADQVAAQGCLDPTVELMRRCVRPPETSVRVRARVEAALEAIAPSLSHSLRGACPECGTEIEMYFDVQQFVIRELRDQAAFVYQDVHLVASQYHWAESGILDLPSHRRVQYAEMIAGASS